MKSYMKTHVTLGLLAKIQCSMTHTPRWQNQPTPEFPRGELRGGEKKRERGCQREKWLKTGTRGTAVSARDRAEPQAQKVGLPGPGARGPAALEWSRRMWCPRKLDFLPVLS